MTGVLAPIAAIGSPLMLAYAGFRVWGTFKAQKIKAKNELVSSTKAAIEKYCEDLVEQVEALNGIPDEVIRQMNAESDAKLSKLEENLEAALRQKPSPDQVAALKSQKSAVASLLTNVKDQARLAL